MYPESEKILLAGPSGLFWSVSHPEAHVLNKDFTKPIVFEEYISIIKGLSRIVGRENLVIGYNSISYKTEDDPFYRAYYADFESNIKEVYPLILNEMGKKWPRDAYLYLPDYGLYAHPGRFEEHYIDEVNATASIIGEGGKSIFSDDHLCLAEDLMSSAEVNKLISLGCMVGGLPRINEKKQKYHYVGDDDDISCHIDGHACLIRTKTDKHHLVLAKSYFEQDRATTKKIIAATQSAEVDYTVVDDSHLPPLSFNLLQFSDNQLLMTSQAGKLSQALSDLVGSEYIQETNVPIYQIPQLTRGSMRCLTNTIPEFLEKYFTTC